MTDTETDLTDSTATETATARPRTRRAKSNWRGIVAAGILLVLIYPLYVYAFDALSSFIGNHDALDSKLWVIRLADTLYAYAFAAITIIAGVILLRSGRRGLKKQGKLAAPTSSLIAIPAGIIVLLVSLAYIIYITPSWWSGLSDLWAH